MARSISQWFKGTLAYAHIKCRELAGLPILVEQSKAERRAEICSSSGKFDKPCDHNVMPVDPTWAEKWAGNKMREALGEPRRTVNDFQLGVCNICSCELRHLVHFHEAIVTPSIENPESYPAHCWKRRELAELMKQ